MSDQKEATAEDRGNMKDAQGSDGPGAGLSESVHSANAWEKAEFGDDSRKQKFLRLMGAAKKQHQGRFVIGDAKAPDAVRPDDKVERMTSDLEKQYVDSIQKKVSGGRKKGLGFSEPEPEPQPQSAEPSAGEGQGGCDAEQKERDMQMRQSHHDSAKEDDRHDRDGRGGYRDQRDNYRDRDRYNREGHHDQRDSYRDRRDNRDRRDDPWSHDYGYHGHSQDRNNQHQRDNRSDERQDYGGYQQHPGGYGRQRSGFGQYPNQGNYAGNQNWSQNSVPDPASAPFSTVGVAYPSAPPPPPPPSSQGPPQPPPPDPRAKFQMSFVKSSD